MVRSLPVLRRQRKGFLLVVALISLLVFMFLGITSLRLTTDHLQHVEHDRAIIEAMMLAEAAADAGEAYLRTVNPPPTTTLRYPATGEISLPTGTCSAEITPRVNPFDPWSRVYVITGSGRSNRKNMTRKVIMQLTPISFSLFGYFEDTGLSNNWWVSGLSRFDGPFHTNGTMQVDWKRNATDEERIFYGVASSVAKTVRWGGAGNPRGQAEWKRILVGGQSAMSLGADKIPFPTVSDEQKFSAWGASSNFPTTPDVYLNQDIASAGIYIESGGQPCKVTFSLDTYGRQVITIEHKTKNVQNQWVDKVTELTVDQESNYTGVRTRLGTAPFGNTVDYFGVPNGVIFCTGDITSLKGTLGRNYVSDGRIIRPNCWTVATNYNNNSSGRKSVTITDNLVYCHQPDYENLDPLDVYNLEVPALGVIGYQVNLSTSCPYDMNLHGVYMGIGSLSNGSIHVNDIDARVRKGQLQIFGGTVVKTAAILGQYNPNGLVLLNGYHERYTYDHRMASSPLMAFPRTNQYMVTSWQFK